MLVSGRVLILLQYVVVSNIFYTTVFAPINKVIASVAHEQGRLEGSQPHL